MDTRWPAYSGFVCLVSNFSTILEACESKQSLLDISELLLLEISIGSIFSAVKQPSSLPGAEGTGTSSDFYTSSNHFRHTKVFSTILLNNFTQKKPAPKLVSFFSAGAPPPPPPPPAAGAGPPPPPPKPWKFNEWPKRPKDGSNGGHPRWSNGTFCRWFCGSLFNCSWVVFSFCLQLLLARSHNLVLAILKKEISKVVIRRQHLHLENSQRPCQQVWCKSFVRWLHIMNRLTPIQGFSQPRGPLCPPAFVAASGFWSGWFFYGTFVGDTCRTSLNKPTQLVHQLRKAQTTCDEFNFSFGFQACEDVCNSSFLSFEYISPSRNFRSTFSSWFSSKRLRHQLAGDALILGIRRGPWHLRYCSTWGLFYFSKIFFVIRLTEAAAVSQLFTSRWRRVWDDETSLRDV